MTMPTLTDAQIDAESPLDEAVMKEGFRDRDAWLYEDADNGGSGLMACAVAIIAAMLEHTHDGSDGQGEPIDSGGIATDAVSLAEMLVDLAVGDTELAANTLREENFEDFSVTSAKFSGALGTEVSGDWTYDMDTELPGPAADEFVGETHQVANPLGRVCIVAQGDITLGVDGHWHVRQVTASTITLGLNVGRVPVGAGTAYYSLVLL